MTVQSWRGTIHQDSDKILLMVYKTMALLHIVNKSHFDRAALQTCLRLAKSGSGILLIEDAVYAAQKLKMDNESLADAMMENAVYALEPDIRARGIPIEWILDEITLVDYEGFVDLATRYDNTMSWL
jgi:tRNA 2-thiouridine synthesizing protein B